MKVQTSLFELASRFIGMREVPGSDNNGFVTWAHSLVGLGQAPDETAWCSSWLNALCFLLGLERSGSAAARSWLRVGAPVEIEQWQRGDIVILKRGEGQQPGPEVLAAPGHVGIVEWIRDGKVLVLGGNQGDSVSRAEFGVDRILGIRRLRVA